ncbi:MAG: M48 family metallopeptidase [Pseudomonadota bacterium]
MSEEKVKGKLTIGAIDDNIGKKKVYGFLIKTFPKAPPETLAVLLKNPKASLVLTLKENQAEKMVLKLNALGAKASFAPVDTQPTAQTLKTPVDINKIKSMIIRGFQGKIEKIPIPFLYRIGLGVTAFIMLLLPLIYLAFITGIGYLLLFHIRENITLFHELRSARGAIIAYVAPIIIGFLLMLFMVKPIFARRWVNDNRCPIDPKKEPFLYAYVEKIADMLGAPLPAEIYTIMQVNASAGLKRGIKGFFSNELELTIGLPLVAGMNLYQLTEVIGHEFGHFSQTVAMRFSYIIRLINHWFARVVYEKDEWDVRIKQWSKKWDFRISIILYFAMFFIWLTRKVLWMLMWIGEVVSCFMMRQMEYNADRHGLALIGADVFQSGSERLEILSGAHQWAYNDLGSAWREGRLVDNLPALIQSRANRIPQSDKKKIIQSLKNSNRRGLFDTHPSTAERIAHARKYDKPPKFYLDTNDSEIQRYLAEIQPDDPDGIYRCSPPSTILFSNFPTTCKEDTNDYYTMVLEQSIPEDRLIPFEQLIKNQDKEAEAFDALEQVFGGQFNMFIKPEEFSLPIKQPKDAKICIERIKTLKAKLNQQKKEYSTTVSIYKKIHKRMLQLDRAIVLLEAGFTFNPKDFNLTHANRETVEQARSRASAEGQGLFNQMKQFEATSFERIEQSLSMLAYDPIIKRIPDSKELKTRAQNYMETWNILADSHDDFMAIESSYQQLIVLAHQLEDNQDNELFIKKIHKLMHTGHHLLQDVKVRFADSDYPFDHAEKNILLGHFLVGNIPREDNLGELINALENGMSAPFILLGRLIANLAAIVVQIEKALNIS